MINIKSSYCPSTSDEREIKFCINGKFELGYFCSYLEVIRMIEQLQRIAQEIMHPEPVSMHVKVEFASNEE